MTDPVNPATAKPRAVLKRRRLALLGTVGALGLAVLAGASNGHFPTSPRIAGLRGRVDGCDAAELR